MPLNADEMVGGDLVGSKVEDVKSAVTEAVEKAGEKTEELGKAASEATGVSEEGLSLFVKLALAAVIIGGCFAWIKAHSGSGGSRGTYEKVGV